jgi:hypothetical protein
MLGAKVESVANAVIVSALGSVANAAFSREQKVPAQIIKYGETSANMVIETREGEK